MATVVALVQGGDIPTPMAWGLEPAVPPPVPLEHSSAPSNIVGIQCVVQKIVLLSALALRRNIMYVQQAHARTLPPRWYDMTPCMGDSSSNKLATFCS